MPVASGTYSWNDGNWLGLYWSLTALSWPGGWLTWPPRWLALRSGSRPREVVPTVVWEPQEMPSGRRSNEPIVATGR